jgi:hypothetical protein
MAKLGNSLDHPGPGWSNPVDGLKEVANFTVVLMSFSLASQSQVLMPCRGRSRCSTW